MFSAKLSRVAQRASGTASALPTSTTPTSSAAAPVTTQCLVYRPACHQRRSSSSKTSSRDDSDSKPAPAAEVKPAPSTPSEAPVVHATAQKSSRKVGRQRRPQHTRAQVVPKSKEIVDQFAGLPAVPGLYHVHVKDYRMSQFFSLHRPVSLMPGQIPPPASIETFSQIFHVPQQVDSWANGNSAERKPEDVVYTLHNTIDTLENATSAAEEQGVRWEVLGESSTNNASVRHLDGAPNGFRLKSFDELVASFQPFKAPPPPQPFPKDTTNANADKKKAQKHTKQQQQQQQQQAAKKKSYATTIVVTESTTADGQRTYSASSSPIVRLPDPAEEPSSAPAAIEAPSTPQRLPQQPFKRRMHRRQWSTMRTMGRSEPGKKRVKMLLISVKRQRKLKMKKHKYKKLMKRTRNLRRRLDRI